MGPHARFEKLCRAHAGRVRAYALRRTSAATADDVVSAVLRRARSPRCSGSAAAPSTSARAVRAGGAPQRSPTPTTAPVVTTATAQVARALDEHGRLIRTHDGGRTWQTVWTVGGSQPAAFAGHSPMLSGESPDRAEIVVSLTRGHVGKQAASANLVVCRTADAGRSWQHGVVSLPSGG